MKEEFSIVFKVVCCVIIARAAEGRTIIPTNEIDPIIDTTYINVAGKFTPLAQESKSLGQFFKFLQDTKATKRMSVIGKDSKYIYLLVSDLLEADTVSATAEGPMQDTEAVGKATLEESSRIKRSIFLSTASQPLGLVGPTSLRSMAIPIALFNFLGYLPVRIPGVPYHKDTGSPDHYVYNIENEFF